MFSTVLVSAQLTVTEILVCACAAVLCGLIIAFGYRFLSHPSKSFSITIATLPVMVMMVILMVNGNLGVGVAVAGSFSLVRFRSLPGRASDIGAVFLAMAIGLACGTGYVTFAIACTIFVGLFAAVLSRSRLLADHSATRYLTITIPEDLNQAEAFADLFSAYTKHAELTQMKTVNLGALYELRYEVVLKEEGTEKQLLDAIRTRNGNLTVMSSLRAPVSAEL